ncbi:hypothetical protein [Micromonospora sp. HM5-17]|uniref:hypothetical protein n=1 Tax=Micromonospora sp. HM5-17 TaxID=2487710 RepID=UPI001F38E93B|nr:hypothetical protein [Micromonospora sp. HM5-17]
MPSHTGRDEPSAAEVPPPYEYPSVEAYRTELPWDSELLRPVNLNAIQGRRAYRDQVGSLNHLLSMWKEALPAIERAAGAPWDRMSPEQKRAAWADFLDAYIEARDGEARGEAFANHYVRQFNLRGLGYTIGERYPGNDFEVDAFLPGKVILEFKAGGGIKLKQANRRARLLDREQAANGVRPVAFFIFGEKPSEETCNLLDRLGIQHRYWPAPAIPRRHPLMPPPPGPAGPGDPRGPNGPTSPAGPAAGPAGSLAGAGQHVAGGTSTDGIANSPDSAEQAAAQDRVAAAVAEDLGYTDVDESDVGVDRLGGVDFSTLELRYVADTYSGGLGSGIEYAYRVDAKPGEEISFGGRRAAQLAADSFFIFLALPPTSFTVNLNPDEPHRIIDAKLGTTDAGRVLLEADLQMKKTVARLIHPNSRRGRTFWDSLRGETKCLSMRQWIVPRPAVVREDGNRLFIIDAPLEVKMETEYVRAKGAASDPGCATQASRDTEYNERIYRNTILPELEKAVNTAPEYADLRRVYTSRVAAEWYRQRSKTKTTAYGHLIDSGDVSAWPSRVSWKPKEVFDRFVKSYREGEFRVERQTRQGDHVVTYLYVYGGVDLTRVPKRLLSAEAFTRDRPRLATTVSTALSAPTSEDGTGVTWLGGRTSERPPYSPLPAPTSPLRMPVFYVLVGLPVLAWLGLGAYLLVRRRASGTGSA